MGNFLTVLNDGISAAQPPSTRRSASFSECVPRNLTVRRLCASIPSMNNAGNHKESSGATNEPLRKAEAKAEERATRWKEDNREAIESSNAWVEANGLPLEQHRLF